MTSQRRTLFTNTIANFSAQAVVSVVAFVTLPFLFQSFGKDVYGTFLIASSIVGLTTLLDFGIGITTVKQVAYYLEKSDHESLSSTVVVATVMYSVIGVLVACVLLLFAHYADTFMNLTANQAYLLKTMLYIHASTQIVVWPSNGARQVLAGHQAYATIARISIAVSLGSAGAVFGVLLSDQGPLVLTAATALFAALGSVALIVAAVRKFPSGFLKSGFSWASVRSVVRESLPIFVIQVSAFLMRQQADRLVIGSLLGATYVAFYEVAAKLAGLVIQVSDLGASALLPYASRLEAADEQVQLRCVFIQGSRFLTQILTPGIVVLIVWIPRIILVWCGPDFAVATMASRLLVASQLLLPMIVAGDCIFISKGRYHRWAPWAIGIALVNVTMSLVLVWLIGITGAALSTLVVCWIEAPIYARLASRELSISSRTWWTQVLIPGTLYIGISVIPASVLFIVLPLGALFTIFGFGASVLISYLLVYGLACNHDDRTRIILMFKSLKETGQ